VWLLRQKVFTNGEKELLLEVAKRALELAGRRFRKLSSTKIDCGGSWENDQGMRGDVIERAALLTSPR
jgi:hypothetical protein